MGTAERGGTRMEFVRYAADSYPTPGFTGETDYAVLYAGESCCLLDDIPGLGDRVTKGPGVFAGLPHGRE